MHLTGHKFHPFAAGMTSTEREAHSYNLKKAPMPRLQAPHPGNMPGTTIPVAIANRASDSRNNFVSPNPPDVIRMSKGLKIVGLV